MQGPIRIAPLSAVRPLWFSAAPSSYFHQRKTAREGYLRWYVLVHCLCFLLYAGLGKGFAYAGASPIFVGEVLLLCGLWAAIRAGKLLFLACKPIGFLLILFSLWELGCTLPFVDVYGVDALRDAVLWVYSIFAWIVAALILRLGDCTGLVVQRFRKYGGILIALALASFLLTEFAAHRLPTWPGTTVSIPHLKAGDMCVHVAGAMSFLLVGLGGRRRWWLLPALGGFLSGAVGNRGGAVACIAGLSLAFLLFPRFSWLQKAAPAVAVLLLGLALLAVLRVQIKLPSNREFSLGQLENNAGSIVGGSRGGLDNTIRWRLEWWHRIIGYTFGGPYFWTGKGYGVNLTTNDGMARNERGFPGLRSPHNSHLTFLARSGVPGVCLWALLQTAWAVSTFRGYWLAKRRGSMLWARIFGWLLAYWLAFLVNACFDVSFEGPVSGIPFWTIFGLGWGARIRFSSLAKGKARPARVHNEFKSSLERSFGAVPIACHGLRLT